MTPDLSIVIPVHNEAGNLTALLASSVEILATSGRSFEIIIVDDASTDATPAEIDAARARWTQCVVLRLLHHEGQAAALLSGLRAARGRYVITLDGDGQNDPRDIPALLALVESNTFDLVCGYRVNRQDSRLRRVMSRLANSIRRGVLDDDIHDAGCQLRVFRREVCDVLYPMELLQSFIPSLAVAAGFRVGEHPVRHHPRRHGASKYGLRRLWWRPAVTMLVLRWQWWRGFGPRRNP